MPFRDTKSFVAPIYLLHTAAGAMVFDHETRDRCMSGFFVGEIERDEWDDSRLGVYLEFIRSGDRRGASLMIYRCSIRSDYEKKKNFFWDAFYFENEVDAVEFRLLFA